MARGARAGTAYVEIDAEMDKLKRRIAREMGPVSQKAGRQFSRDFDRGLDFSGSNRQLRSSKVHTENLTNSLLRLKLVGGALALAPAASGLNALSAGAVAATGSTTPLIGLLAEIPSLASAAAQGLATVKLGTAGVGDALKAALNEQAQGSTDAAAAMEAERATAERVRSAKEALTDAQREATRVQEALTDARRAAKRELEDMRVTAERGASTEKRVARALNEAQAELAQIEIDPEATRDQILDARERVQLAREDLADTRREVKRARKDYAEAKKDGVKGMPQVVEANRAAADSSRAVERAERDVTEATKAASKALQGQSAAATASDQAMAKLSPRAQEFVRTLLSYEPVLKDLQATSAEGLFPGVEQGLESTMRNLPIVKKIVGDTSKEIGGLAALTGRYLGRADVWRDIAAQASQNDVTIRRFGRGSLYLADALRHVTRAADPLTDRLTAMSVRWARNIDQEAKAGRQSGATADYFERTGDILERLLSITGHVGSGIRAVFDAGRDDGDELWLSVDRVANRFDDWANSLQGQEALSDWFADGRGDLERYGDAIRATADRYWELRREGEDTFEALSTTISEVLAKALSSAVENAAERADDLAVAFVKGFLAADTWGRLAIGTWLIAKMGGLGKIRAAGTLVGSTFGSSVAGGMAATTPAALAGGGMQYLAGSTAAQVLGSRSGGYDGRNARNRPTKFLQYQTGDWRARGAQRLTPEMFAAAYPGGRFAMPASQLGSKAYGLGRARQGITGLLSKAAPFAKTAGMVGLGFAAIDGLSAAFADDAKTTTVKARIGTFLNKVTFGIGPDVQQTAETAVSNALGQIGKGNSAFNVPKQSLSFLGIDALRKDVGGLGFVSDDIKQEIASIESAFARYRDSGVGFDQMRRQIVRFGSANPQFSGAVHDLMGDLDRLRNKFDRNFQPTKLVLNFSKAILKDKPNVNVAIDKLLKDMDRLKPGAQKRAARAGLAMIDQLEKKGALSAEAAKTARLKIEGQLDKLARNAKTKSKRAADNTSRGMQTLIMAMEAGILGSVKLVNQSLRQMGFKPLHAVPKLKPTESFTPALKPLNELATGGMVQFGRPGDKGRDTIPVDFGGNKVAVGSGEVGVVFNRHQIPEANARFADVGGLPGFFEKNKRPHYLARGGMATSRFAGGGIVGIPWQPGEEVAASILPVLTRLHKRFGFTVTDAFDRDRSAGHKSPGHNVTGTAVDAAGGDLAGLVSWAVKQGLTTYWNGGSGATPLAGHDDHAHVEFGGAGGNLANTIAQAIKVGVPRLKGDGSAVDLGNALLKRWSKRAQSGVDGLVGASLDAPPSGAPGGPVPDGSVKHWLAQALRITGHFSKANLEALYGRTMQESGGNPRAQNNWDSNARAGTPSKGILQTIDPTFQAHKLKGYDDIWNPVHNAVAAIRYMMSRYGHIVGPSSSGYAKGGIIGMVGDSLGVGTKPFLKGKFGDELIANVAEGRSSASGVQALKGMLGKKFKQYIFDLGSNDETGGQVKASLNAFDKLTGKRAVHALTLNGANAAAKNSALRATAGGDVNLINWAGKDKGLLAPDGLHATEAGYKARAGQIAQAIRAVSSKADADEEDAKKKEQSGTNTGKLRAPTGPLAGPKGVLRRTLRHLGDKDPKKRRKSVRGLLDRIKGVGLSTTMQADLKTYADKAAEYGEWASRAGQITQLNDDENAPAAVVNGDTETGWLQKQLDALFQYRNQLVRLRDEATKKHDAIMQLIEQSRQMRQLMDQQIEQGRKLREKLKARLKKLTGKPAKELRKQIAKLNDDQTIRTRLRDSLKSTIIPGLDTKKTGLATARTDFLGQLDTVQGIGSPTTVLGSLPPIGVLGGDILNVQTSLAQLTKPKPVADKTDSDRSQTLEQLLRESNLRAAVSDSQFKTLQQYHLGDGMPPFGGSFKTGGDVPGPIGAPRTIIAHGGERVLSVDEQNASGSGGQVNIHIAPGMEWLRQFIRVEVSDQTRQMTGGSRRATAGVRGGV